MDASIKIFECFLSKDPRQDSQQFIQGRLVVFENKITFFRNHLCFKAVFMNQLKQLKEHISIYCKLQNDINIQLDHSIQEIKVNEKEKEIYIQKQDNSSFIMRFMDAQEVYILIIEEMENLKQKVLISLIQTKKKNFEQLNLSFQEEENINKQKWEKYRTQVKPIIKKQLQLENDDQYKIQYKFSYEGITIQDFCRGLFSDEFYKPTDVYPFPHLNLNQTYQNPFHFLYESILDSKDFQTTTWNPPLPSFLLQKNDRKVPQEVEISKREISFTNFSNFSFLGQICAKVNICQSLILVDQDEFYLFFITHTQGFLYSDKFIGKGFYQVKQNEQGLEINLQEVLEWENRIYLISNQIDSVAKKESEKIFKQSHKPFFDGRVKEIIIQKDKDKNFILKKVDFQELQYERLNKRLDKLLKRADSSQKENLHKNTFQEEKSESIRIILTTVFIVILFEIFSQFIKILFEQ